MVLVDGVAGGKISTSDRGLSYGDGLFETIAVVGGIAQHWHRHLSRLSYGASRLGFDPPDSESWGGDLAQLLTSECSKRAVLKLTLTRGCGGRGYAPPPDASPTRITQCHPWPRWPAEWFTHGLRLIACRTPLAQNPALAGIKHLNRLEQVLAAREVLLHGADDGLMFALDGRLIETTRANLFLVFGKRIVTPELSDCGIAGVMREVLLEHLPEIGFKLEEAAVDAGDISRCDEMFLTNSVIGVLPVKEVLCGALQKFQPPQAVARIQNFLLARGLIP